MGASVHSNTGLCECPQQQMRNVEGLLITRTEVSEIKCAHRTQNKKKSDVKSIKTQPRRTATARSGLIISGWWGVTKRFFPCGETSINMSGVWLHKAHTMCVQARIGNTTKNAKKNLKNVVSVLIDEKIYHTIYNSQWKLFFRFSIHYKRVTHCVFYFFTFLFSFFLLFVFENNPK